MKKDSLEIDLEKGLKLIISPHTEGALCFDEADAVDYGESRWQLQEGREYEYEFVSTVSSEKEVNAHFEETSGTAGIIIPRKNKKYEGSIKTGLYVGSLKLFVDDNIGKRIASVCFEIQSIKTDYRSDYRKMLNDITEYYTDLVMLQGSPVTQKFEVDNDAPQQTLYQKFAFVKSIVDNDAFEDAVHKIIQSPVRKWKQTTVVRHIENVRRIGRNGVRQILSRTDRIPFDGVQGLTSIPRTLEVLDKCDTVDTIENQFVKYVLTQFYGFCSDIAAKKNASDRLKAEANATCNILLKFVGLPFFKDVSMPQHINLNSPVLQRKEGYREILQGWLIFDLAAKLGWSGGDNVYEAGKRNVAALYEYWLFFKLLEIISDLFKINPEDKSNLIKKDNDGLNLEIKQGKMKMISGVSDVGGRNINIRFYYNRTFGHRKELNESGSWTVPMRPDYTLSMWPGNIDEAEAEKEELIVHIHFDAKYRVNKFIIEDKDTEQDDIDDEDSQLNKELSREKDIEESGSYEIGMYKRMDLLKMHAYKDAIRRTSGAYVLYPGTEISQKCGYHEIIPGLGAFCISPGRENDQVNALKSFLSKVKDHMLDRASQREKMALQVYDIYKRKPSPSGSVCEPLPESVGRNRYFQPDETYVLLGYYKSQEHLDWILKSEYPMYNARAGSRAGSVAIDVKKAQAKYLSLHNKESGTLYKLSPKGPQVYTFEDLKANGYPCSPEDERKNAKNTYLMYRIHKMDAEEEKIYSQYTWNCSEMPFFKGKDMTRFQVVKLSELMKYAKKKDLADKE